MILIRISEEGTVNFRILQLLIFCQTRLRHSNNVTASRLVLVAVIGKMKNFIHGSTRDSICIGYCFHITGVFYPGKCGMGSKLTKHQILDFCFIALNIVAGLTADRKITSSILNSDCGSFLIISESHRNFTWFVNVFLAIPCCR